MQIIHLANTDFEFELAHPDSSLSIEEVWMKHPICLQLQYLPLLYASENESIVVSQVPAIEGSFILLGNEKALPNSRCISWGASLRVQKWCERRNIEYQMPPWDVVQEVNSKMFSFMQAPRLHDAELIWNAQDLKHWLDHTKEKRVLKTCFGLSGRGHYFIKETQEEAISFCQKEWKQGRPLIAEPWVDRFFDFSTQWEIDVNGQLKFIGSTVFESDSQGAYQATLAGSESQLFGDKLPFLEEHKRVSKDILGHVAKRGFFGFVGVDAFLYRQDDKIRLQPVVEINGRQTMSVVALRFQRKWHPDQVIRLAFTKDPSKPSLLPNFIFGKSGKRILFNRFLSCEIINC